MTRDIYNKAVDTLLDAYNKGKLEHGNCFACAVGSLLGTNEWQYDFITVKDSKGFTNLVSTNNNYVDKCTGRLVSTYIWVIDKQRLKNLYSEKGFTKEELSKIEYTFESSLGEDYYKLSDTKEGQFMGLTAVLKLMATMVEDEIIPESIVVQNQERLQKVFEKVDI